VGGRGRNGSIDRNFRGYPIAPANCFDAAKESNCCTATSTLSKATGRSRPSIGSGFAALVSEAPEAEGVLEEEGEPEDGGGEKESVDAVEDASVAGEHGSGVFDAGSALDGGLEEVA
jgi:hypothetical protein